MNRFFAPGGEFSLIEKMFGPESFSRDAKGLGDDAFLFEPTPSSSSKSRWLITADTSAEGVHYRLDWTSPERALRKALLANLSDINAMGGRSRHVFLNLGAAPQWGEDVFIALGKTLRALEGAFGFRVSGGDTVRTLAQSFFAFTVLGELGGGDETSETAGRALLRSACAPGQRIYVSGSLGGSAAGLWLLQQGESSHILKPPEQASEQALITAHFDPEPPLNLGPLLASLGKPVGAIDISDGLSSELWHLSRQSGCALRVVWENLPAHPDISRISKLREEEQRAFVLHGGEEYQLLFTGDFSAAELERMRSLTPVTEIGKVEKGEGVFLTEAGKTFPLPPGGFSHGS